MGAMYSEEVPEELVDEVGAWLREARRIVVFTGAGISTDSGIPDFRGPQGLWTQNPLAEKTSTLSYYLNDPEVRKVAWAGRVRTFNGTAQPNEGHRAICAIQNAGKLAAVVTQNVDGLHQASGIVEHNVVEVHGTIRFGRCWECNDRRPMGEFIERVIAGDPDPHCELCGGVVKSDAILFEQSLVPEVIDRAFTEAEKCDVLIAVGSSLSVSPANGVVPRARNSGAKVVIINGEPTQMDHWADRILLGSITPLLTAVVGRAEFPT
jgi:NAD-dependent deacetylase